MSFVDVVDHDREPDSALLGVGAFRAARERQLAFSASTLCALTQVDLEIP